jgi:hypothetical protein
MTEQANARHRPIAAQQCLVSLGRRNEMTATLTLYAEQRELLAQALADAVFYRDPPADCHACQELNDESKLCEPCAVTFALASSYLDLGSDLGMPIAGLQVQRPELIHAEHGPVSAIRPPRRAAQPSKPSGQT